MRSLAATHVLPRFVVQIHVVLLALYLLNLWLNGVFAINIPHDWTTEDLIVPAPTHDKVPRRDQVKSFKVPHDRVLVHRRVLTFCRLKSWARFKGKRDFCQVIERVNDVAVLKNI